MSTIGTIELIATIDTSSYKKGAAEIDKANAEIESSADKTSKKSNSSFLAISKVGLAAVAAAAVAAGAAIVSNIGSAVRRVDTLNNFPNVMANLGYGADEANKSLKQLDMGVRGLPTSLDSIAMAMQRIAPSSKSLDQAAKLALAMNNAIIAGGAPAAAQAAAMEQLSQAILRGKFEMEEFKSVQSTMPGQLAQIARSLGFASGDTMALYESMKSGTISMEQFKDSLLKLNSEGLTGYKSFADQAKSSTAGLNTGWQNFQTSITRGIASIIQAVGSENISQTFGNMGKSFEGALKNFAGFVGFVIRNKDVFVPIALAIVTIISLMTAWTIAVKTFTVAQAILNAVLAANPIGLTILAIAGLTAAFIYLWNNVEGFRNFFIGAWDIMQNRVGSAANTMIYHFERIRSAVGDVFNWIRNTFGTIGQIGASIVRGAVNSVLGFAERTINGFINMINNALKSINKIPGVNIGRIANLSIPQLAQGGIVTSPTLAMVGEGRESEAVIPLSKLDKMLENSSRQNSQSDSGSPVIVNLRQSKGAARQLAMETIELVNEGLRAKNLPEIGVAR